jgi:hypothetical protein
LCLILRNLNGDEVSLNRFQKDFGCTPSSDYISLLLDGTYFQSNKIKQTIFTYLVSREDRSLRSFASTESQYKIVSNAYSRIKATHQAYTQAKEIMKANPSLYAEQLTLPIKCSEYTELLIANTHFKRDNARAMMEMYFGNDTKLSLKSCILNNASYSTIHAAKERIKATHKLFIRAILLTEAKTVTVREE